MQRKRSPSANGYMNRGKSKKSPHNENAFVLPTYTPHSLSFQANALGRFAIATVLPWDIRGTMDFLPATGISDMISANSTTAPSRMATLRMAFEIYQRFF